MESWEKEIIGASLPAEDPTRIANAILASKHKLPPLETTSGFRKLEQSLSLFFPDFFKLWKSEDERIQAGVCELMSQMSIDGGLGRRLLKEGCVPYIGDLLTLTKPLLVLTPAIKALSVLTAFGETVNNTRSKSIYSIAEVCGGKLVRLAEREDLDVESEAFSLIIVTLGHSCFGVYRGRISGFDKARERAESLGLAPPKVAEFMARACAHPDPHVHGHAMDGLYGAATYILPEEVEALPSVTRCLIGQLRSWDRQSRVTAMQVLHAWSWTMPATLSKSEAMSLYDEFMEKFHRYELGSFETVPNSYMVGYCLAWKKWDKLMESCPINLRTMSQKELCRLGNGLYDLIMTHPFELRDNVIQEESGVNAFTQEPLYRNVVSDDSKIFLRAAEALKEKYQEALQSGNGIGSGKAGEQFGMKMKDQKEWKPSDLTKAVCLELKGKEMEGNDDEVLKIVEQHLDIDPDCSYLYYIAAKRPKADLKESVKWAQRGLKCKGLDSSRHIKASLLASCALNGTVIAMQMMSPMGHDDELYQMKASGTYDREHFLQALLQSSYLHGYRYLGVAPKDDIHRVEVVHQLIRTILIMRGDKTPKGLDSPELKWLFEELDEAEKALEAWKYPTRFLGRRNHFYAAFLMIKEHYSSASEEWDPILEKRDYRCPCGCGDEDRLTANVDPNTLAERVMEGDFDFRDRREGLHPRMNSQAISLFSCSYCDCPSATLKKCALCGETRYCDARCQKRHWKQGHKEECAGGGGKGTTGWQKKSPKALAKKSKSKNS